MRFHRNAQATTTPQREDTHFHPRSIYGITKASSYYLTSYYRESHGIFALGPNAKSVKNITDMGEKMHQVLVGAYSVGGPKWMTDADIRRIDTRPDELYRQKTIA